jgi:phosphatidylserine/phosphatidylglycerophosphate/cardiolipin synthase-like enzyme
MGASVPGSARDIVLGASTAVRVLTFAGDCMRTPTRNALVLLALFTLSMGPVPASGAVANHVVISQFATRGPSAALDEFVELYNPTENIVSLSNWKLQYKSATGSTWADRAVLPAGVQIAAHGYFLLANPTYVGSVVPDYNSASWTTGLADNGNIQIIDGAAVTVDKVGFGTGNDPEGGVDAPTNGTSPNNNSIERKANAASTAASLATGGADAALGNGEDTNVNGSDFVAQTNGRHPQNSSSPPEPGFANGGSGTGHTSIAPATVFASRTVDSLYVSFSQDSAYTLTNLALLVPSGWSWSHSTSSLVLSGAGFAAAVPSVVADTIFVSGAALTTTDGGLLTLMGATSPAIKGTSTFLARTSVAAGALAPIVPQPSVRVLELVPIVTVHVNNASGVCASPYAVGAEATVSGIVTANLSSTRTSVYVQDGTAGINLFNAALPPFPLAPGDSITATGSILQFRGLTELQPDFSLLVRHATGRPVPEPMLLTCAQLNATFQPDYTEPNEGRLVRINAVTYNPTLSTITDATGTCAIFIPTSFPPTPSVFDAIGVLQQFKPGSPAPGPPYTADYELAPRTPDDIIPHAGPIVLTAPYEDPILPTSVRINWTTDVASSSVIRFGTTAALGDSVTDGSAVTSHAVTIPGLQPATVYYYSAGSTDGNGTNFTSTSLFSTASPPASTGAIHAYFNKSVLTNLAWLTPANGGANLPALLVPRFDNAQRTIDAAVYSLSGTPGTTLANALIAARNRGIRVRVICEYDNIGTSALNSLTAAGIPLINDRFDPVNFGAGLMHNKFFVIDGRGGAPESTWVWTGSWNPTDPGTNSDYQNSIEVQDQALANAYTLEFEEMWGSSTETPNAAASRFGAHKLDNTPHRFSIGGRKVECYFSPSDGANYQIFKTINAAQHSVGFELLTLTRSDLSGALINQKNAGLKVRGDLDNGTDTGTEYGTLVTAGVDVHLNGGGGLLHHKYLIVDADNPHWDGTVLTGSHNWSASAENSNNENTLIVHDTDIANQYLQEFSARYYQFGGTDSVRVTDAVQGVLPRAVSLSQNWPNPFRGSTQLAYSLPTASKVSLRVYDVQGREVRTLVNELKAAGRYSVTMSGQGLAAGVYLCRFEAGGVTTQRKMLFLK